MEEFDDGKPEAVVEDVVLESADDFGILGVLGNGAGVQRLDPTWVDQGDAVAFGFERVFGFQRDFHHGSQRDEADVGSGLDDFCFANGEEFGLVFDACAGAVATRVADRNGAVLVVGHGPEHVDEFIFILGLHVNEAGNVPEIADVEESVVSRAVVTRKAAAVHAKTDREVLQGHVMKDHVIGALHEGRVDREERTESLRGVATGKEGGVLLGNADVEVALWDFLFECLELGSAGHGCRDGGDRFVLFGEVSDGASEEFRKSRRSGGGGAVFDIVRSEAVKFAGFVEGWLVATSFLGNDVEYYRLVLILEVFEGLNKKRNVVSVDGAEIPHAEFLEENIWDEHVFGVALDLMSEFAHAGTSDFFDKVSGLFADAAEGAVGLQGVEVFCESANVFINGPFVVVEDDNAAVGGLGDVVEGFQGGAASEGGVTGDSDDIAVFTFQVAGRGHAESGGEGGAGVSRSVAIVFGFGAEEEAIEALVLANGANFGSAAGEHFVDVALVGDVKKEFVLG